MACACTQRKSTKYLWTGTVIVDGEPVETSTEYASEIEARAKVLRKGGSYKPVPQ